MNTVNVSLTPAQVKLVDNLTSSFGFANRSELFRAIIRLVAQKPAVLRDSDELLLEEPDTRSVRVVVDSMRKTGKYNKAFLNSLQQGLEESGYFATD